MSVQVSYKKQILFGFLLLLMVLIVIEGFIRISDITNTLCKFTYHEIFKDYNYFEKKELCQEYRNNIVYDRTDAIQRLMPQTGKYININSEGFRGEEFSFTSKDYKIFFLGGSTAFGHVTSSDDFTIPALIEKEFKKKGLMVKVINAGIPNANSRDELYYIEKYILKYSPDMVIMYDGWNDMAPSRSDELTYEEFKNNSYYDNQISSPVNQTNTGIITFFANIDYKTGLGVSRYVADTLYGKKVIFSEDFDVDYLAKKQKILESNWSMACNIGNEKGFQVVNIIQPILGTGNRTLTPFEKYDRSEFYNPYLIKLNLNYTELYSCDQIYDLRNVFDEMNDIPMFFDSGHTSDFGNEIIAKKIYEMISPIVQNNIQNNIQN